MPFRVPLRRRDLTVILWPYPIVAKILLMELPCLEPSRNHDEERHDVTEHIIHGIMPIVGESNFAIQSEPVHLFGQLNPSSTATGIRKRVVPRSCWRTQLS